ncbi:hypothetical protein B9Z65_1467 [Elsinoe australis]|uniref:Serine hydrolase domain-containing protein n=1 Tax=Elsinoe australis TaxID=40998 RepID=A0A2P7YFZ7_9PEZI|nr:hypothetical protein B9Z65_1467 [Elsinoe australis]
MTALSATQNRIVFRLYQASPPRTILQHIIPISKHSPSIHHRFAAATRLVNARPRTRHFGTSPAHTSTPRPPFPYSPLSPATMSPPDPSSPRKLRILCLHGYTQSGPLFRTKTRALEKNLQKHFPASPKPGSLPSYPGGVEFIYLTGPVKLRGADIPTFDSNVSSTSSSLGHGAKEGEGKAGAQSEAIKAMGGDEDEAWGWWVKRTERDAGLPGGERTVYEGLEQSLGLWARTLREEGPFDGVLGFSQGGCAAGLLAGLLEKGRREKFVAERGRDGKALGFPEGLVRGGEGEVAGEEGEEQGNGLVHPPLKFAVVYSGFRTPEGMGYDAFFEGGLTTPTLHFIGSVDTVVEEHRCMALVEACRGGIGKDRASQKEAEQRHKVVYHPGGHFVPSSQKPSVNAVVGFIRDVVGSELGKKEKEEESVEDMDVPF